MPNTPSRQWFADATSPVVSLGGLTASLASAPVWPLRNDSFAVPLPPTPSGRLGAGGAAAHGVVRSSMLPVTPVMAAVGVDNSSITSGGRASSGGSRFGSMDLVEEFDVPKLDLSDFDAQLFEWQSS